MLSLLAVPLTLAAQPTGKIYRIGYIMTAAPAEMEHLTKALAEELVRLNVDVIVTGSNPVVAAVKRATTKIPVVMATSADPVGSGFVASLARPGGNITGLTADPTPEIQGKRLQLLKELVPRATRMALLWNPLPPGVETYRKEVEKAARTLGVSLQAVEARGRDEFEDAFAAMARGGADAVVVLPDPVFFTARKQVVELMAKYRLPSMHSRREEAEIGGLVSYGSSLVDQFRRAAVYVDKILKGAKPGDLPVEQGAKFELVINLKTAKALGLTIPPSLRLRADHIIE